jgi:thioredoxin reductase (NADPH)
MNYQVIIIGAGTAGLSAAQYCRYHGLSTLLIERMAAGGQALQIPELRNLSGCTESISGMAFTELLEQKAMDLGTEIMFERVESIHQYFIDTTGINSLGFRVNTFETTYTCLQVILATGTKAKTLDIPGASELQGRGISYCAPCDGPLFRNKPVGVVGGGDGAFEEAIYLSSIASEVHVFIRSTPKAQHYLQEEASSKHNIFFHIQTDITQIESAITDYGFPVVSGVQTNRGRWDIHGLFIMVGSTPEYPEIHLLDGFSLERSTQTQIHYHTNHWCETSVPGLFCIGAARKQEISLIQIGLADGVIAAQKVRINLDFT